MTNERNRGQFVALPEISILFTDISEGIWLTSLRSWGEKNSSAPLKRFTAWASRSLQVWLTYMTESGLIIVVPGVRTNIHMQLPICTLTYKQMMLWVTQWPLSLFSPSHPSDKNQPVSARRQIQSPLCQGESSEVWHDWVWFFCLYYVDGVLGLGLGLEFC